MASVRRFSNFEMMQMIADVQLGHLFPGKEFYVEIMRNENHFSFTVIIAFKNKHGWQYVRQLCGTDCEPEDFRLSDTTIAELMLLE